MTGQLSQSMQIRRARDSINAMLATIISESDTEHRKLRSSEHASTVMSRSRSQGTEVTTVTGAFPYRAVTRHHGDFSVMGTILNPAVREATKPYPQSTADRIRNVDTSHNSDAVGELTADRWLKANERLTQRYTNLHIWIEITLAALKQATCTTSIRNCTDCIAWPQPSMIKYR